MQDLAAGHRKVGLDDVPISVSGFQTAGIAIKNGTLIRRSGPFNPIV